MEQESFPEVPQSAEALAARWAERDAQYAKVRTPMDPDQADVIRMMRMQEASVLPNPKERGRMYNRAKSWTPPLHPDFGSMRDWVQA